MVVLKKILFLIFVLTSFSLVAQEEDYNDLRETVEKTKPEGEINQIVYREGLFEDDAWGYGEKICHTLKEVEENKGKVIHWKFDANNCDWAKWGINWNGWYQINLRGVADKAKLQFSYKAMDDAKFKIYIEDFNGNRTALFQNINIKESQDKWRKIEVPLDKLELEKKGFEMDQIKQLHFEGIAKGEVFFNKIKITKK